MATTSQNARVQARVHSHFTSEELEFYAEDEHISIIPNFNSNVLHFLNGDFGPFHSNLGTDVPLWLALALKERRKCRIEAPLWMSIDVLKATLAEERQHVNHFSTNVPFHYVEIAHTLFNHASDNIDDVDQVRTLIEDISSARATKLRKGANAVMQSAQDGAVGGSQLNGVSHMEINTIRRIFTTGLNKGKTEREREREREREKIVFDFLDYFFFFFFVFFFLDSSFLFQKYGVYVIPTSKAKDAHNL